MKGLGKIGIVVAARLSSRRLPRKALLPIYENIPMLGFLIERLKKSTLVNEIVLATSTNKEDLELEALAKSLGVKCFRGDLNNVVDRYDQAAKEFKLNTVIRVTGDCPFVDGELIDYCVEQINDEEFDVASTKGLFPVGLDCEIYNVNSMERAIDSKKMTRDHLEHLTLYFYDNPHDFKILKINPPDKWKCKKCTYTVDDPKDLERAKNKICAMRDPFDFTLLELINSSPL